MADAPPSSAPFEIHYLRLFPWLRIFRCAGEATDPKKLMLAALGLLLTWAGWTAIDGATGFPAVAWDVWSWAPWERVEPADALATNPGRITEPFRVVVAPFLGVFRLTPELDRFLLALLSGLWALFVWALFGGAIARVGVVGLSKRERVGLVEAVKFATSKWRSLIGAPATPLLGVVIVTVPLALAGLLYRLGTTIGPVVAGVLAFLPLIGGLLLALIIVSPGVGWPLMIASIAAEDEDAFDAVSRTYAYVHQRPWHYAAYAVVAALVGIAGLTFIQFFGRVVVTLAAWGLSFGAGRRESVLALFEGVHGEPPAALSLHAFWIGVVALIVRGWAYSYFWTAAGAIYLLLRRDIDGTPFTTVAHQSRSNLVVETGGDGTAPAPPPSTTDSAIPAPHAVGVGESGEP